MILEPLFFQTVKMSITPVIGHPDFKFIVTFKAPAIAGVTVKVGVTARPTCLAEWRKARRVGLSGIATALLNMAELFELRCRGPLAIAEVYDQIAARPADAKIH